MRKVINRRLYDTDTAESIGDWENCCDRGNFHYCSETLYRKRTGELFLHGEGHGLSPYGKTYGDGMRGWGEAIVPLAEDDARDWVEEHLDADAYESLFGPVEE